MLKITFIRYAQNQKPNTSKYNSVTKPDGHLLSTIKVQNKTRWTSIKYYKGTKQNQMDIY
jgi:hypothetical protein